MAAPWQFRGSDVLKGVGAIACVRWLYPWVYTVLSGAPPTALELQSSLPWDVCLAGLGVLLAMSWPVGLVGAAVFGVVLAIFRIVSLRSMAAAVTAIALVCALGQPLAYRLLVIVGGVYVIVRHRANIQRLLAGTEPRLGQATT